MPEGYRHDRYEAPLGEGAGVFDRAAAALLAWEAQAGAGVEIFPLGSHVEEGTTVLGAPLARLAQTRVTRRYIEALAEAVRTG